MKKLRTLFVFTLVAASSTALFAQTGSDDADITAQADVVTAITVTNLSNIDFGNVAVGATGIEIDSDAAGAGAVQITNADVNTTLDVAITYNALLPQGTGTGSIVIGAPTTNPGFDIDPTTNDPTTVDGNLAGGLAGSITMPVSGVTTTNIYVGATITANTASAGDNYAGNINVAVSYQ